MTALDKEKLLEELRYIQREIKAILGRPKRENSWFRVVNDMETLSTEELSQKVIEFRVLLHKLLGQAIERVRQVLAMDLQALSPGRATRDNLRTV